MWRWWGGARRTRASSECTQLCLHAVQHTRCAADLCTRLPAYPLQLLAAITAKQPGPLPFRPPPARVNGSYNGRAAWPLSGPPPPPLSSSARQSTVAVTELSTLSLVAAQVLDHPQLLGHLLGEAGQP